MMDEKMGASNTMNYTADTDFVEVMFAKSMQEARTCAGYLLELDIPSRVENTGGVVPACGVAVMVPNNRLIEATEHLAARADEEDSDEIESEDELDDLEDDFDDEEDDEDDFDDEEDDDFDDDEEEEFEEEEP